MKRSRCISFVLALFLCFGLSLPTQAQSAGESKVIDVLDLRDMNITDVLKLISQKSGLNIVAAQNVKGTVTVYLKNMAVLDVLRTIVDAYGWAYVQEDGLIKVMTAQEFETEYGHKFGHKTETRVKRLVHANPADLVNVLSQIKTASGKIIADDKTGTLVLVDEEYKLNQMEEIIKTIDVATEKKVFHLSYAKAEKYSD